MELRNRETTASRKFISLCSVGADVGSGGGSPTGSLSTPIPQH